MQNQFFEKQPEVSQKKADILGVTGGSLLLAFGLPSLGAQIIGGSVALSSTLGGLILAIPHFALQHYLDHLEHAKKISKKTHDICRNILLAAYVASSAALGAVILGQAILPAVMAAGIGIGILAAFIALVQFGHQFYKSSSSPQIHY